MPVETELYALKRVFMPEEKQEPRVLLRAAVAFVMVSTWCVGTLLMTVEAIETTQPSFWTVYTAIIFLIIGRLWNLELENIKP